MNPISYEPFQAKSESGDETITDHAINFIILPPWVKEAVVKASLPIETVLNTKELCSILSQADVETYAALEAGDSEEGLQDIMPYTENWDTLRQVSAYGTRDRINGLKGFLYAYFLDSELADKSIDNFYARFLPINSRVFAIELVPVDANDNVTALRYEALKDLINFMGKYCSFESISRHWALYRYLGAAKKYKESLLAA